MRTKKSFDEDFELDDELVQEESTTASLEGGEGQPLTPFAFSNTTKRGKKLSKQAKVFTEEPPTEKRWGVQWESKMFEQKESPKKAINIAIRDAYSMVHEAQKLIRNASRIKSEEKADQGIFWKRTTQKFKKLGRKLLELGNELRELNK